jgi:glycosyltransferase involved in cell wall biosynthesis
MQEQIHISVLVITYNHAQYISQTLDSIVSQKGDFVIELIISNDCSTDGTDKAIEEFLEIYTGKVKINYFDQKQNLGILPNLIFALRHCTGDYLAFCEGDDFWTANDKLQKQLNLYTSKGDCAMVISNRRVIREDQSTYNELYDEFHRKHHFAVQDIIDGFVPGLQTMFSKNDRGLLAYLEANSDLDHADRYIAYYFARLGHICLLPSITAAYRLTGFGAWSSFNGLRKLQVKAEMLADFHKRIGLPHNNSTLRSTQLICAYATLRYCLKRPNHLADPVNRKWIKYILKGFSRPRQINCQDIHA